MKTIITGGAGFIGSHLASRLTKEGHAVRIVDRLLGSPISSLTPEDFDGVDALYHLAANSDIRRGATDPRPDYEDTVQATFDLVERMRGKVRRVVYLSGSGVYGDTNGEPVTEWSPLAPVSMYGAAKMGAEALLNYFAHRHDATVWILRPCNVVGPGMTHGAAFDFVRSLQRDPTYLQVLGNGYQYKPYLHVADLLDAMWSFQRTHRRPVNTANVPGEHMLSVRGIVEMVVKKMGLSPEVVYGDTTGGWAGDVPTIHIKTREIITWKPKHSARDAILESVDWLEQHREAA